MTANIKMLPLPELASERVFGAKWDDFDMQDYARAVAEHNISELVDDRDDLLARLDASIDHGTKLGAAQQRCLDEVLEQKAEIERLRAEVAEWRRVASAQAELHGEAEARAERLAEEIDWIKSQPEDDRMFAEIEAAAKASFHRHRTSCRGQVLTRADNYESHLVLSALEWSKRTNGAEQHAERLAEALRELRDLMLGQVKWMPCDCGCPQQRKPDGPHSVTWLRAAQQVEIAIGKAEGKE